MQNQDIQATWYRISLTPEQRDFGFADIIRAELEELWLFQGGRDGFSVWLEDKDETTDIFLSPAAADSAQVLIYRFNGTACEQPRTGDLTFILGQSSQGNEP